MNTLKRYLLERAMAVGAVLTLGSWAGTVAAADDHRAGRTHLNQKFPATGQTTCFDTEGGIIPCAGTGQDGEIQAGATLKYKDNGNGTITDRNTKLVWEKKSDDGSIHDRNNVYTWDEAFAVHVTTLNNRCANDETVDCSLNGKADCAVVGGKCGFAGKRDWRVPNVKELQSIINYENLVGVSAVFITNCVPGVTVLTGSCTGQAVMGGESGHWSSTSFLGQHAWTVLFFDGTVMFRLKEGNTALVRAVRGGLP